jgi:MFS family permease
VGIVRWARTTFGSLGNRNFRLYLTGYVASAIGEWMQRIGQAWLVLELSGSGTLLGATAALQYLPILVLGPVGGLFADRLDKRRLLLVTQTAMCALALLLWALTASGTVKVWMVMVLAFSLGCLKAFDRPAEQSFVLDMVGPDQLINAVTLHSIVFNVAKAAGPAAAGVLIALTGVATSFLVNSASFLAVLVALLMMRTDELRPAPRTPRAPRQMRDGLAYVRRTPALLGPLVLMAVAGMFTYEWAVTLPLLGREGFGGGPETFGAMFSAMGIGAVVGGVLVASLLRRPSTVGMLLAALVFSGVVVLVAASPTIELALVALLVAGAVNMAFRSSAVTLLQLRAAPEMRGRVMSLFTVAVAGTTPVGAPIVGWLAEVLGARWAVAVGGLVTAVAVLAIYLHARRHRVLHIPAADGERDGAGGRAADAETVADRTP